MEKLEPLYIAHRNIKWYNCCENSMIILQKIKNRITRLELPERIESKVSKRYICVYRNIILNSQKVKKTQLAIDG